MAKKKPRRQRRGVVLMIILGLMALFGMIGMTLILVSGQARQTAKTAEEIHSLISSPEEELDLAAKQVLRGTNNAGSVLSGPSSLLEDIYGQTFVNGAETLVEGDMVHFAPSLQVTDIGGGQLMQFLALAKNGFNSADPPNSTPLFNAHRYVGCVLTMLDHPQNGPAAGLSTRILGYQSNHLQIAAFEGVDLQAWMQSNPSVVYRFTINGLPFSGTGLGFQPVSGNLNARAPDTGPQVVGGSAVHPLPYTFSDLSAAAGDFPGPFPIALLPNPTHRAFRNWVSQFGASANEDYDAVDYQNMLLAMIDGNGNVPIPSLHRPALINYWLNRLVDWMENGSLGMTEQDAWLMIFHPFGQDGLESTDDYGYLSSAPPAGVGPLLGQMIADMYRRIVLRPSPLDHPNFTGSNSSYAFERDFSNRGNLFDSGGNLLPYWLLQGVWDVDNDGDGQPDSIWVDLGFSARQAPDGRWYKPLFAILCTDLDGRLNLNVHGNFNQTVANYYNSVDPSATYFFPTHTALPFPTFNDQNGDGFIDWELAALGSGGAAALPRGLGMGPADINLNPALQGTSVGYAALLRSRYGASGTPGQAGEDQLSQNKCYAYDSFYWNFAANIAPNGAFGTPHDLNGGGAIALDPGGRPHYSQMAVAGELVDDPYEMNVLRPDGKNNPFTPNELEALLRPYDHDSQQLPGRLGGLVGNRHGLTTENWDVPCPNVYLPRDLRTTLLRDANSVFANTTMPPALKQQGVVWMGRMLRANRVIDLLEAKMYMELRQLAAIPDPSAPGDAPALVNLGLQVEGVAPLAQGALLSLDLLAGLKMDVNRAFGNGRDDNNNNVIDEEEEASPAINRLDDDGDGTIDANDDPTQGIDERDPDDPDLYIEPLLQADAAWNQVLLAGNAPRFDHTNSQDYNGDGVVNDWDRILVRQMYARHLYVLAMMLIDLREMDNSTGQTGLAARQITARRIAQWAINVVDFRDRDSIMTPFEYDLYPFTNPTMGVDANGPNNTWDVNGRVGPTDDDLNRDGNPDAGVTPDDTAQHRGLVWGCERPELVISETLAVHQRRVQDLMAGEGLWDPMDPMQDQDFDQLKRPEGSLFVELYNPTSPLEPRPGEYSTSWGGGVDLDRVVVDPVTSTAWPVWRLLIVPGVEVNLDPDDPILANRPTGDRCIYFTDPTAAAAIGLGDDCTSFEQFYPDAAEIANIPTILPGRYAVIGPGTDDGGGEFVTYLGTRSAFDVMTPPFSDPADNNSTRQIRLIVGGSHGTPVLNNGVNEPPDAEIHPVASIPINLPNRLSISEPAQVNPYPPYPPGQEAYAATVDGAFDDPFDLDPAYDNNRDPAVLAAVRRTGTAPQVCVVHLQRLANPLQPYEAEENPYRTIDSAPIDLTAFNGWDNDDSVTQPIGGGAPADVMFEANQRGEDQPAGGPLNNIWAPMPLAAKTLAGSAAEAPPTHRFAYVLQHSLGYLSDCVEFEARRDLSDTNTGYEDPYRGFPATTPFPWLNWNNRPFVSQMELMMVPKVSSSQLLNAAIATSDGYFTVAQGNPYNSAMVPGRPYSEPFGHLFNFFYAPDPPYTNQPRGFGRMLDFLYVPSRFVGAELEGNPLAFLNTALPAQGNHAFHPPFNRIPQYREPGRVNINTVFNRGVWNGLLDYFPDTTQANALYWAQMRDSRQAYVPNQFTTSTLGLNKDCPTRFADPFRSYAGRDLVPLGTMAANIDKEVNATLLRPSPGTTDPLFRYTSSYQCTNTTRNPFFRYQALQRLGNLVTTRSNVHAVWITSGYFEVTAPPVRYRWNQGSSSFESWDAQDYRDVYPDGYALGPELGSDMGEIKRHRAFYIIDRSIPVGFVRGEDSNAAKTVLLRRFIE